MKKLRFSVTFIKLLKYLIGTIVDWCLGCEMVRCEWFLLVSAEETICDANG